MKRTNRIAGILLNAVACGISATVIFPLIWMAYSSVKPNPEFMQNTLALPRTVMLSNYAEAFEIGKLGTAVLNSLFYSGINVIIVVILSITTAYFLARYDFRGKKAVRFLYTLGMLIPLYALLVPMFVQYKMLDMINNRLALIVTYYGMSITLSIFLAESFIAGIPKDIDEASVIDECSMSQRLIKVIFPLCKPIIATTSILTLLNTWNEFAFAVILTPREDMRTVSIALRYFTSGKKLDYTFLIAALMCTSLPIILAYLVFSKEVIKGMTAGAIKG